MGREGGKEEERREREDRRRNKGGCLKILLRSSADKRQTNSDASPGMCRSKHFHRDAFQTAHKQTISLSLSDLQVMRQSLLDPQKSFSQLTIQGESQTRGGEEEKKSWGEKGKKEKRTQCTHTLRQRETNMMTEATETDPHLASKGSN